MKKLILVVFVLLLLPLSAEADCWGRPSPYGTVCGTLWKPGWVAPLNIQLNVKFCRPGDNSPFTCKGAETFAAEDYYGTDVVAFRALNWGGSSTTNLDWDVFVWSDADYYGSSTIPINRIWLNGYGGSGYSFVAPPRPLPPTPVYPAHGSTVGNTYTVIWNSGVDAERSSFPATWAIWYKYWLPGETEPAQYTLARDNMPCHDNGSGPDAQGRCSTFIAGPQPAGHWKYKVVATFNVSGWVPAMMGPTYFSTESAPAQFTGQ